LPASTKQFMTDPFNTLLDDFLYIITRLEDRVIYIIHTIVFHKYFVSVKYS